MLLAVACVASGLTTFGYVLADGTPVTSQSASALPKRAVIPMLAGDSAFAAPTTAAPGGSNDCSSQDVAFMASFLPNFQAFGIAFENLSGKLSAYSTTPNATNTIALLTATSAAREAARQVRAIPAPADPKWTPYLSTMNVAMDNYIAAFDALYTGTSTLNLADLQVALNRLTAGNQALEALPAIPCGNAGSPTPPVGPFVPPVGTSTPAPSAHVWYTSSYATAVYYYCDLDDGWRGLSLSYLKSYPSEQGLLAVWAGKRAKYPQSKC